MHGTNAASGSHPTLAKKAKLDLFFISSIAVTNKSCSINHTTGPPRAGTNRLWSHQVTSTGGCIPSAPLQSVSHTYSIAQAVWLLDTPSRFGWGIALGLDPRCPAISAGRSLLVLVSVWEYHRDNSSSAGNTKHIVTQTDVMFESEHFHVTLYRFAAAHRSNVTDGD
jgi:hypothetical protein